jgi:hypothetical protein
MSKALTEPCLTTDWGSEPEKDMLFSGNFAGFAIDFRVLYSGREPPINP